MADPITNKVQVTGYTGVQAGVVNTPSSRVTIATPGQVRITNPTSTYMNAGAILGGEISYKGSFARAEVGAGTALSGKIELGHSFDIGRNMGLELSGKAQANMNLIKNKLKFSSTAVNNNLTSGVEVNQKYNTGETRLAGAAKLTFGSTKAKFGVGVEAGSRNNISPDMNYNLTAIAGPTQNTMQASVKNKPEFYATPTVSADVKISKNLSFNANADLHQAQAGIRWNF